MTGQVNLYTIYFGLHSDTTMDLMDYFAAHIGNSSWYDILSCYYQVNPSPNLRGVAARTYISGGAAFVQRALYMPSVDVPLSVSTQDMLTALINSINNGNLPIDCNGIYSIIFRGDFLYDGWGNEW